MPEVGLKLLPGVQADLTPSLNQSAIQSCNLIRFRDRLPQKLGGWDKFYPINVSGVPRDIHAWQDLNDDKHLAVGTTTELDVISEGTLRDITPQTLTSDFTPDFSTTSTDATVTVTDPNVADITDFDAVFFNTPVSVGGIILEGLHPVSVGGTVTYAIEALTAATSTVANGGAVPEFVTASGSAIVTVNFTAHGQSVGETFTAPIDTSVGGLTIGGTYLILTVPGANSFTISATSAASATDTESMNGGDAQLVYYIAIGPLPSGLGFGIGPYGAGAFGSGITPDAQVGDPITTTNWSLDNWGKILLACPKNGGIYYWSPDGGFQNAKLVWQAPIFNGGIFVAMPAQILVAWASIAEGEQQQDPLVVRWSAQEDFEDWAATAANQAGTFRIPTGSRIVGGMQGPRQALIWTDIDLYAMQYLGADLVFGFDQISTGCGLIGQHAAVTMRGNVYWMSPGNFFVLAPGGGVQEIPCSVWDVVFQNLDTANQEKCVAAANSAFDEVTFYYPSISGGSGEIDSYVKFNTEEKTFDYGTLQRTAWTDQSVLGEPIGTTANGIIYQHETSPDADGQPLMATFTTGWFVIAEGDAIAFLDWLWPDMKWGLFGQSQAATVMLLIEGANYPNETPVEYGPFSLTSAVSKLTVRVRKRLVRFTFYSTDVGSFWRLGLMRGRIAPDGKR